MTLGEFIRRLEASGNDFIVGTEFKESDGMKKCKGIRMNNFAIHQPLTGMI